MKESRDVFREFVAAINAHDVPKLCRLMSENHVFIDSLGTHVCGRAAMRKGWVAYFRMVPDYCIDLQQTFVERETIMAFGQAYGTFTTDGKLRRANRWSVPSAWRAAIENGHVAIWQVFADNEPIRALMRQPSRPP